MTPATSLNRRSFFAATAGAALAVNLPLVAPGAENRPGRLPVIGFIKPFQKLPYSRIADIASEIGWDGIECPVRKGGTIEPEAAGDELPKLAEALRRNRLSLPVIATDVDRADDPLARKVLQTAAALGIRQYRLKHLSYDLQKPLEPQLQEFQARLRDLAQLNEELGVQGTLQNHSGPTYVGAPVWDLWRLVRQLDPKRIAIYFDIGHATVEGGSAWPLHARIAEPSLAVVSVKDFVWRKRDPGRNRWEADWCPLGEGMVQADFFAFLGKTQFSGPVSQHFEYDLGTEDVMIEAIKKDFATLRRWLDRA